MIILAGERQLGRQVSPIREQNVALGVPPSAGSGCHRSAQLG